MRTKTAADILEDVGPLLYGNLDAKDMEVKIASALGLPPRVLRDTMRGHGGITRDRLMRLVEERAQETARLRDALRACGGDSPVKKTRPPAR